jgi:acetylornithine deacetylase/succinyl-diaminopimelate desuccinylase-like protein
MFRPDGELSDHAFDVCQRLLRIDTTNPPGDERVAADLVATELASAGLEPMVLESAPRRANVVTRLRGDGSAPPLLLTAHLDVVEADASAWRHPPFSGVVADGCLWGRGAIDMKNMAAMITALLCRLARERVPLARDLVFAAVADEEAGCALGSGFLCDHHAERVRAEYAIGEGGGFNMFLGERSYVTVQVAEKGYCWVRARTRGEPGHGSMPREDSAVVRLAASIARLGRRGLPARLTPVAAELLRQLGADQPAPVRALLTAAAKSGTLPHLLRLMPDKSAARGLAALLANTASPTVLRAGAKTNVIPPTAECEIDGRTLPGQSDADFLRELGGALGPDVELEVMRSAPPVETRPVRSALYDTIVAVLAERAPEARPVPSLLPGFTDAKSFTRLGARWYGFAPVRLPRGMRFADMFHGHDERIPVDGLRWGTETLADVVVRFAGRPGTARTPARD